MFCTNCGKEIADKAVLCIHCGCKTEKTFENSKPLKSRAAYICLGLFFGGLGVHNFYAGYVGRGITQLLLTLFVVGIFFVPIWVLVEIIAINKDVSGNLMN